MVNTNTKSFTLLKRDKLRISKLQKEIIIIHNNKFVINNFNTFLKVTNE